MGLQLSIRVTGLMLFIGQGTIALGLHLSIVFKFF